MTNGNPTDPQAKLAKVVAEANRPPEPPGWVQKWQMVFGGLMFVMAIAIALILVLEGPPAPKSPDAPEGDAGAAVTSVSTHGSTALASGEAGNADEQEEGDEGDGGGGEEEEASLASLNEQAPWAFAIVALLVGAFLATGKTLNFSGTKGVVQQQDQA